jgi:hypothetical protein
MENKNLNTSLDNFLDDSIQDENIDKNNQLENQKVIKQKDGLLERIDKTLVTKDGKTLLKEIYR